MGSFNDLIVYQKAFQLSLDIYDVSKQFPSEEKYSLTSQIRRSSRSVCANIAEGYRKRQYPAHFLAKLSDADMENTETNVWLDFSLACNFIDSETFNTLKQKNTEIGRLLGSMIKYPEKYTFNTVIENK